MLSGLFKTKPAPTRLESSEALKQPLLLICQLRSKESELKQSSDVKGVGSVDYRKHDILENLIRQIDNTIKQFNEAKPTEESGETEDIIIFVRTLSELISTTLTLEETTLMKPRNSQRENLSNAVYYGTFGIAFFAGTAISAGTLGKLATLVYVAPKVSKSVHEATGLNDLSPSSIRLLNQLSATLADINENLTKTMHNKNETADSEYEDFLCPITHDIMKDPVVCTLDGRSYERSVIVQWLTEHGTSPCNRMQIPDGKSVNDVLIKHINFSAVVEKFRREHPLIEQDYTADVYASP